MKNILILVSFDAFFGLLLSETVYFVLNISIVLIVSDRNNV